MICVQNGDAQLFSVDAGNEFANPGIVPADCSVAKLAEVSLGEEDHP